MPITITVAAGVTVTTTGNFTQSLGTFNGGNGKMRVGGSFSLSGGTFKSTSGRLEIGGGFSKTGGTFTHNSGEVMLNASSGSQTFATGGATFYDLTINDGLVGYWKLDEGSGTSTADSSGYGNTGTLGNAPTWIASGLPGVNFTDPAGLSFNGSTNYVSLGTTNLPAINAAQTISLWAKLNSTGTGQQNLLVVSNQSSAGIQIEINGSSFGAYSWGAGTLVATTAPSTGTWHHVAYTYDGASHQTLYIDGSATTATVTNQTGSVTSAYLGTYLPNNQMFNGSLDEVRIYNRVLSATEVSALATGYQPGTYLATQTMTGSPTVSDSLTLASGYLAMGANTIQLAGSWWNYGGVLSATYWGGAAINLTGSATTNTIQSGGQFLPSLNVTGTGKWTLADNLDVDPNATVTMTTGSLDISSRTLRTGAMASGSGTLTTTGATVILDGNSNHTLGVTPQNNLRIEDPSEANLVGYWKFDETQGTAARDWTGNGLTGTLVNTAKWSSSVPSTIEFFDPSAIRLDGTSAYVDVYAAATPSNAAFTACGWVTFTSLSGAQTVVAETGTNSSAFILKRDSGGKFAFLMTSADVASPTNYQTLGTTTVGTGTWYHVCGVYNGSTATLYVNGKAEGTPATVSSTWAASGRTYIGASWWSGARADYVPGTIDDVRIYNVALTAAQVTQLAHGRYANTGGTATVTLGGGLSANGGVNIDSGAFDPGAYTLTASGGLTVHNAGTLQLDTTGGAVALGSGTTLTVDGTLYASTSGASIESSSGAYAFYIGSTSTATPTLNISGLTVENTAASGMYIDGSASGNTTATTTFINFNNIAFSNGTSGGTLLQIYAPSLALVSDGCTFDASTTYTVKAVGDGFTSEATQTRAIFGNATCSAGACQNTKSDNDSGNGQPTTGSGGAIVQFLANAPTDTAGTIVGFPTAAFSWNTGAYYATYVAFNNASGTAPTVYVRDSSGAAKYSWSAASGETMVGTPRWTTEGTSPEKHYVYLGLASGKVYRLLDTGSALAPDTASTGWSTTNPYNCACTISTGVAMDTSNLYWAGQKTSDGSYRIWAVGQATQSVPGWSPMQPSQDASPNISPAPAVTGASLATWTSGGSTYVFLGQTGYITKANVTSGTVAEYNSNPGAGNSIQGRITVVSKGTNRVLAGDDHGDFWSVDPANFTGTNKQWGYTTLAGSDQFKSAPFYDYSSGYVHVGSEMGKLIVLNAATGATLTGYPMTTLTTDPIETALLYRSGVVAVGTTTGKLFFVNRITLSGGTCTGAPSLMREYYFGSNEQVSGIAYDSNANNYLITTSSTSSKDGRLYTISAGDTTLTDSDGCL